MYCAFYFLYIVLDGKAFVKILCHVVELNKVISEIVYIQVMDDPFSLHQAYLYKGFLNILPLPPDTRLPLI